MYLCHRTSQVWPYSTPFLSNPPPPHTHTHLYKHLARANLTFIATSIKKKVTFFFAYLFVLVHFKVFDREIRKYSSSSTTNLVFKAVVVKVNKAKKRKKEIHLPRWSQSHARTSLIWDRLNVDKLR